MCFDSYPTLGFLRSSISAWEIAIPCSISENSRTNVPGAPGSLNSCHPWVGNDKEFGRNTLRNCRRIFNCKDMMGKTPSWPTFVLRRAWAERLVIQARPKGRPNERSVTRFWVGAHKKDRTSVQDLMQRMIMTAGKTCLTVSLKVDFK